MHRPLPSCGPFAGYSRDAILMLQNSRFDAIVINPEDLTTASSVMVNMRIVTVTCGD